jgi:hypothetical protein
MRRLGAVIGVGVAILGTTSARASTYIATSIDTMKESADAAALPMTVAQIDDDVAQLAKLNPTYITVNTPMDKATRYREWVQAIRAHGRKVWHRPFGYAYPASLNDTPAQYLAQLRTFILQNPDLFKPGDILDGYPEADGLAYWRNPAYFPPDAFWWPTPPNQYCDQFNKFLVDLSTVAQDALLGAGISGVDTGIRSLNPWWATSPCLYDSTITALGGYLTMDVYFPFSTDPAANAGMMRDLLAKVHAYRPAAKLVLGEWGYSNEAPTDDQTQRAVVAATLDELRLHPYVYGLNYWVGAGGPGYGGYTNILQGSLGAWSPRPAALELADFYLNPP